MKIGVIVPVLSEIDVKKQYDILKSACDASDVKFDVIYALNNNMNKLFSSIRTNFIDYENIRAIKFIHDVNEHKMITIAMKFAEHYDAVIIYSGKEEFNEDVLKAFIASWKAGNKIVYLKKHYTGIKKFWVGLKRFIYKLGIKMLNIFSDRCAENDIQLLDQEVVKTINQLPSKNQQLRVFDSFVGYQTDVIDLRVGKNVKINESYTVKSKAYKGMKLASILSIVMAIACLAFEIVALSSAWDYSFLIHMVLWLLFMGFGVTSFLFLTRSTILFRAGEEFDPNEMKDIIDKVEKYNFKS